jgi:hypothetical protein
MTGLVPLNEARAAHPLNETTVRTERCLLTLRFVPVRLHPVGWSRNKNLKRAIAE